MFDLYTERSPAVFKAAIMLEECELEYRIKYISVSHGQQHSPEFKKLSPNEKIPVLVDFDPVDGAQPVPVFESGAILVYLAEKTGRFLRADFRSRTETMQWLFWQSSGLSPMSGQIVHFTRYAPEHTQEYGTLRYKTEVLRLYGVLNERLQDREFMCGDYSIADIGTFPWILMYDRFDFDLAEFPNVKRWFESVRERPAVKRAYTRAHAEMGPPPEPSAEMLKSLFGKNAPMLHHPSANFEPKEAIDARPRQARSN
jgi:GST-like protein